MNLHIRLQEVSSTDYWDLKGCKQSVAKSDLPFRKNFLAVG